MNGCSSRPNTKNIHLASGTGSWDTAAEADTGCRQEQGAPPTAHGLEAAGNSEQGGTPSVEDQPFGCRRQLVACLLFLPPKSSTTSSSTPDATYSELETGLLLRQVTTRTYGSTLPARQDWTGTV